MRNQLQKFTDFTNTLLPHETAYLLSIQQLQDEERLAILRQVDFNAQHIDQFTPYDTSIDKRKYSHLQAWIQSRLQSADVDEQFNWMLDLEQKIMTDTIRVEEEKALLSAVRNYQHPAFFFAKFYEVVGHYRHFLLIRLRYADHGVVDAFLHEYREVYLHSKDIHEKLHGATLDIVGQYSGERTESRQWEKWLSDIFYDEKLDGLLRYLALVRLTFISHNYRKYDLLREKFDYLDRQFSSGMYYSKRLLLNYYNNRLMLHSNFREYDRAVYFGYLSIRAKTHDHLLYVNNLCAVLLRLNRIQEALQLMKKTSPEVKKTKNFHNRVGFVAFYMEALNNNGMYKNAESYGNSFLKAYANEVLQYRWHLFFSVYLEAMMHQGHYDKLLKIAQKYRLQERDKTYQSNAKYLPVIPLYVEVAKFKEGLIERPAIVQSIGNLVAQFQDDPDMGTAFKTLMRQIKAWLPEATGAFAALSSQGV